MSLQMDANAAAPIDNAKPRTERRRLPTHSGRWNRGAWLFRDETLQRLENPARRGLSRPRHPVPLRPRRHHRTGSRPRRRACRPAFAGHSAGRMDPRRSLHHPGAHGRQPWHRRARRHHSPLRRHLRHRLESRTAATTGCSTATWASPAATPGATGPFCCCWPRRWRSSSPCRWCWFSGSALAGSSPSAPSQARGVRILLVNPIRDTIKKTSGRSAAW